MELTIRYLRDDLSPAKRAAALKWAARGVAFPGAHVQVWHSFGENMSREAIFAEFNGEQFGVEKLLRSMSVGDIVEQNGHVSICLDQGWAYVDADRTEMLAEHMAEHSKEVA